MTDRSVADEPGDVTVPVEVVLPGMRLVGLPDGESWVGALIVVKTEDEHGEQGWSVRRTEGLSDEELLGMVDVAAEMLRGRIRSRQWIRE